MFIRTSTQKRSDGSTLSHLQVAESYWDAAKKRSGTRIVWNVGRVDDASTRERLEALVKCIHRHLNPDAGVAGRPDWHVVDAWPLGDVWALEALWKRVGLADAITAIVRRSKLSFPVERALFALVANRAIAPASKLYAHEQWLREDVRIRGAEDLALHHLYRAMDVLDEHKEHIEEAVFNQVANLFNLDVEVLFYDTTSLHFESEAEPGEEDAPDGGLRKRGYSKNGRSDATQIVVGMAVTRDGFPVRHWVFPGNTVDVSTVKKVREDLRGWKLHRCVFVGDAGMVSADNLRELARGGGRYIVAVPMTRGGDVVNEVLTRAGRYKTVAENLKVKEVSVGEGERRQRYVLCHNPEEEKRQRAHREQVLRELEAELLTLRESGDDEHSKRACALRASRRFGRYLKTGRKGGLELDRAKITDAEKLDGKFVVTTNDDSLTAEDMALGYKQLLRIEEAWRRMKSGLDLRPVFHWTEGRIRAHVAITVHALMLERAAEKLCADTWRNIRDDLKQVKLVQLSGPEGTIWQATEPNVGARSRLSKMKIEPPPLIWNLV